VASFGCHVSGAERRNNTGLIFLANVVSNLLAPVFEHGSIPVNTFFHWHHKCLLAVEINELFTHFFSVVIYVLAQSLQNQSPNVIRRKRKWYVIMPCNFYCTNEGVWGIIVN